MMMMTTTTTTMTTTTTTTEEENEEEEEDEEEKEEEEEKGKFTVVCSRSPQNLEFTSLVCNLLPSCDILVAVAVVVS